MSGDTVKYVGLIGLGYWGKNLLRNFIELGALRCACDVNPGVVAERKKLYPDVCYTSDVKVLFADPAVKAIAIASSAISHYALAKEALLSGKDVFVEKPLALTVREGEELAELAGKKKLILMVGHVLYYHPALRKLKDMIVKGELGKIRYIYSCRLNIGKLRTEENILWSFAPHDISAILMLLEEEPLRVSATGGDYLNPGIDDVTLTTLEFRNGIKGHIFVSWLHPYKEQKLVVVGSENMAVFDDTTAEKLFFYPHKIEWKNGRIPVVQKAEFHVVPVENGEPLKLELTHFLDCVRTRRSPLTDGNEGVRVLKVLEAAEYACGLRQKKQSDLSDIAEGKYFAHGTAVIDEGAKVGEGTSIWHFSHILKGSSVGKGCKIGQNVVIGPNVSIGDNCKIQNNVSVYEGVTLQDNVFCGPSCVFTNVINPRCEVPRMHEIKNTLVKEGVSIGANATIVCGHSLGKYAFVGAGSVVTGNVPDYALVYGNPARVKGWVCECGIKIVFEKNKGVCPVCKKKYKKTKELVERIK